jgi:hypothetical protein
MTMPSSKYQSLVMGIATLGVISGSALLAPSANAFTIGDIGSNTLSSGFATFSEFSTTTADLDWRNYVLTASSTVGGPQLSISVGATAVRSGVYNLSYKVTTTEPVYLISVNQNGVITSSQKSVSLTPGGANILGFPITSNDSVFYGSVIPALSEFYVTDSITVNPPNGYITSVANTYGVPEPLTMLGAMTAAGFGVGFKRKLAKAGKKNSEKA